MFRLARVCSHTFEMTALGASSAIVDLGLNEGAFASALIRRYGCHVHGMEPVPQLYRTLPAFANLRADWCAVAGDSTKSTLLLLENQCARLGSPEEKIDCHRLEVPVVTLPEFLESHHISAIDLLKVDIEGAELGLFSSLPDEVYEVIGQITIEFHDFLFPSTAPDVRRVIQTIQSKGFRAMKCSRNNIDWLFLNKRRPYGKLLPYLKMAWLDRPAMAIVRNFGRAFNVNHPDTRGF